MESMVSTIDPSSLFHIIIYVVSERSRFDDIVYSDFKHTTRNKTRPPNQNKSSCIQMLQNIVRIARAITTTEIEDIILFDVRSVVGGIDRVIQ